LSITVIQSTVGEGEQEGMQTHNINARKTTKKGSKPNEKTLQHSR
jgi:hypothetical protein